MKEGLHYAKRIEDSVLGLFMLESTALGRAYGMIDEQIFHFEDNRKVYRVLKEMYDTSSPCDKLDLVWQKMVEKNVELSCMIGHPNPTGALAAYLASLTQKVVNSAHLEYECHILKEMWRKRELLKLTMSGIDSMEDVRRVGYHLNDEINRILGGEQKKDWYTMDELMFDLMLHQNDIKEGKKEFVTTGFRAIDKLNGGFSAGQLIILGARPSVGKSALMGKMGIAVAKKGKSVGVISLEMNNNEIAARLASLETNIEFWKIYRNLFDDENQHRRFYEIISRNSINLPLRVSDKTKVDVGEIRAKAAKLKHKYGLDFLMVDYLQLVDSPTGNKNYNREQEVAKISRGLKLLAMDMQIPVLVLCQLNRAVTQRKAKDRYPQLSDLRESGAIEQDADVVMMLHRDWMSGMDADEHGASTEHSADLLGVKWRNGATFHLELDFDPEKMKFSERPQANLIPLPPQKNDAEEEPF